MKRTMDKRMIGINRLIAAYCQGNFNKKLEIKGPPDELNTCKVGINLLGEELAAKTITMDYVNSIVNSVSDMVFIVDIKGMIKDVNRQVLAYMECEAGSLVGKHMDGLQPSGQLSLMDQVEGRLKGHRAALGIETVIRSPKGPQSVRLFANWLSDKSNKRKGIVITARDITEELQAQVRLLSAIISAQEMERRRLAKDLHDSFGQQLAGIKMSILAAIEEYGRPKAMELLVSSNNELGQVFLEMKRICLNLMPPILERFGLIRAVKDLCSHPANTRRASFTINVSEQFPRLGFTLEIDLFRIIQEFINNAFRHGKATHIHMDLSAKQNTIRVVLKDNGKGFNVKQGSHKGMGLRNVESRIQSHNGNLALTSSPGKGTEYTIQIETSKKSRYARQPS